MEAEQSVPERLPLLDALLAERAGGSHPLQGAFAVLIQHQLGSMVPMTRALIELGLDPARIWWVDIPYTANGVVREALKSLGMRDQGFVPSGYSLDQPYERYQRRRVTQLALELRNTLPAGAPLLVLDDGSYFLDAMACLAAPLTGLRVVEQTTRGLIRIRENAALRDYAGRVSIANVADCRPKRTIEGPRIGVAVAQALHRRLKGNLPGDGRGPYLVLGFGTVGHNVAMCLTSELGIPPSMIHVSDPDPLARSNALKLGFQIWERDQEGRVRFHMVVGCSGTTSFGVGDRVFLEDGAVLASASSGSAELSRESFIELADTHPADDIFVRDRSALPGLPLHSDIWIHVVDREVQFLNGGFPINFDGEVNCVPPRLIQATHALQVGAAIEVMASRQPGLQDLSEDLCTWVERRFHEMTSEDVPASKISSQE